MLRHFVTTLCDNIILHYDQTIAVLESWLTKGTCLSRAAGETVAMQVYFDDFRRMETNRSYGGWMMTTVQVAIQGIEDVDDHRTSHPHPTLYGTAVIRQVG